MRRSLYEPEHDAFREAVRAFVATQVVPFHAAWEEAGVVDRGLWLEAGKQGLLGFFVGQVMKETGGKADPRVVNERVREKLGA